MKSFTVHKFSVVFHLSDLISLQREASPHIQTPRTEKIDRRGTRETVDRWLEISYFKINFIALVHSRNSVTLETEAIFFRNVNIALA